MARWSSDDEVSTDERWDETQLSVPVVIAGAKSVQDAINIAVAEVGTRTKSAEARSSEILVQDVVCPSYGYEMKAALCMTDLALVALTVLVKMLAESHEETRNHTKSNRWLITPTPCAYMWKNCLCMNT